ncbi:ComF family protein [Niallia endozanthoxylica]|uniref:ComF family protein n=2 Tax=Niallia endozanthoxylica TaxID=2036016 RepID=A0A5J5HR16_9BACI|nr:ComF family protein [Niallia endozanthoxylica]
MRDYCLICFTEIIPQMGWNDLIAVVKKQTICPACKAKLEEIKGETCSICDRPLEQLDARFIQGDRCYDCVRWEEDSLWQGCLTKNHSLYLYNEFLQEVISRYKFRGDYILANLFTERLLQKLTGETYDSLVPIPLSPERLQERGFNQAEAIIREASLNPANILTRIHGEKQSKKSRNERIHANQVFQLAEQPILPEQTAKQTSHSLQPPSIKGQRIILIDDVYTTGSTLRHAAKVLTSFGAASVTAITIARG